MDLRKRLSRRERQIMDGLYRLGSGTVAEVREQLPEPPGYDAVRTTLRNLESKGFVEHSQVGQRYVYRPAIRKQRARQLALADLVETFFAGSAEAAAVALLKLGDEDAGDIVLERLRRRIEEDSDGEPGGEDR